MTALKLKVGAYRYEHTEPIFDGRVPIDGVDATMITSPLVSDVFQQMAEGELDIAEYGLTYFLRTFDLDDSPFLALPIFPNRNFRHSSLFVNAKNGIDKPQDLAGKTVGEFALWGSDPVRVDEGRARRGIRRHPRSNQLDHRRHRPPDPRVRMDTATRSRRYRGPPC